MGMKLNFKTRKKLTLLQPNNLKSWATKLTSEVFATATISFLFAGLFIIVPAGHIMLDYLYSSILIAIYSGFVVIGILFVFFIRWSADANPIISMYKTMIGEETYLYCFAKIIAQTIGAIIAGLLVWACTQSTIGTAWNIYTPPSPALQHGFFEPHNFSKAGGFFFAAAIEIIVGLILLWSVFTTAISDKYRLLIVLGMTMFATLLGSSAQIMNFNASRALAQDIGAIFKGEMGIDQWLSLGGIFLGTLLVPFILIFLQWFIGDYLNPLFQKVIDFKNPSEHIKVSTIKRELVDKKQVEKLHREKLRKVKK